MYEEYFPGSDRDTLHNTRSATKTLAGMLVGLAIDHGHLAGADARIFDYVRNRKVAHPDPR